MDTTKPIKMAELTEKFGKGAQVIAVEYRSSLAETIKWRDRETKAALEATTIRHTVEVENGAILVNERAPDGLKPEAYIAPFKKGDRVALWFTEVKTDRGVVTARGALQRIIS